MEHVIIRTGIREDLPQVHGLVRELARFEKAEDQVITTAEQFARDGFDSERPCFEFFVAEQAGKIVGIAVFYFGYSTWKGKNLYLDDLFITESARRQGIAQRLFDRLVAHARAHDAQEMRWHVLDWNEPAIRLYEQIGASLDPEWITCKLNREQIRRSSETLP